MDSGKMRGGIMKLKIKGINDGLLMTLPNLPWEDCCDAVRETIGDNVAFYAGANLFLDAGDLDIRVIEITSFRNELEKNGIFLKGIFGRSEKTMQNCRSLGLMTEPAVKAKSLRKESIEEAQPSKEIGETCYLVNRTVRSGNVIERKESIVVIGDVNPGAEIISEKNIVVLGTVRGRLSAGGAGNPEAYISAEDFDNAQIIINGVLALIRKEDVKKKTSGLLMVRNRYGELEIENK